MKLATLNNNTRDGALLVVSRDLSRCIRSKTAPTLQAALDAWDTTAPFLQAEYELLEKSGGTKFDPAQCMAPLPRAYQWADGSAYVVHVELVRKARGAEMPESFWTDPLMYQGGSDAFLGPCDPIRLADEAWGIDYEAEVAVITDDVPMGVSAADAVAFIKLVMLVNDVSLRNLIPGELAKGFGFFQSKPSTSFSPVVVTPDELGRAWDGTKLHRPLLSYVNGTLIGEPNAGVDMVFGFPELIAHAAKTRPLKAGCIIGSGTVANRDPATGSSCLAEVRCREMIEGSKATTSFLQFGDNVRIDMHDEQGQSIFGAIDQRVEKYQP